MSDNNNNDGEGQYWWILPLLGFLAVVGFMMGELALFAALP